MVIVVVPLAIFLAGFAYRVFSAHRERAALRDSYPRLERLVAAYSLLSWRAPAQTPPRIREDGDYGGSEFHLSCNNFRWGTGGFVAPGELFACLREKRPRRDPIEGDTITTQQLSPSELSRYHFEWESLFGYELIVTVDSDTLFGQASKEEGEHCREEVGQDQYFDVCTFGAYKLRVDGLRNGATSFRIADGLLSWNADGSVNRRDEWVVYFEGEQPITAGQINKFLQLAAREMQIVETDLTKIVPQLEVMWNKSGESVLAALNAELERVPDLTSLSSYLVGK